MHTGRKRKRPPKDPPPPKKTAEEIIAETLLNPRYKIEVRWVGYDKRQQLGEGLEAVGGPDG